MSAPPVLLFERRLAALVGHLKADLGDLGSDLEHGPLDAAPDAQNGAHRAGRLDNAVRVTPAMPSISASTSACPAHQFALLLHHPQLQHLGLYLDVISVGLTAGRLLRLASQLSQVGNAVRIARCRLLQSR